MSAPIFINVSAGELIDKITILEIKVSRITDEAVRHNVSNELAILSRIQHDALPDSAELRNLQAELKSTNEALWMINDHIRDCEARKDFSAKFIELARGICVTNDFRATLKKQINELTGSTLVEEKYYAGS
jgi:hypothetical protein